MALKRLGKFMVGQIIEKTSGNIPTVQVRVPRMVLDEYLLMFFNHSENYYAVEPKSVPCKVGDIVKIMELPEQATPLATHEVCEMVFKMGEIIDPITGKRCRGMQFIDENQRELMKKQLEKESGQLLH